MRSVARRPGGRFCRICGSTRPSCRASIQRGSRSPSARPRLGNKRTTGEILQKYEPARPLVGEGTVSGRSICRAVLSTCCSTRSGSAVSCRPKVRRAISSGAGRQGRGLPVGDPTSRCSRDGAASRSWPASCSIVPRPRGRCPTSSQRPADAPAVCVAHPAGGADFPETAAGRLRVGPRTRRRSESGFDAGDMLRVWVRPGPEAARRQCRQHVRGRRRRDDDRRLALGQRQHDAVRSQMELAVGPGVTIEPVGDHRADGGRRSGRGSGGCGGLWLQLQPGHPRSAPHHL